MKNNLIITICSALVFGNLALAGPNGFRPYDRNTNSRNAYDDMSGTRNEVENRKIETYDYDADDGYPSVNAKSQPAGVPVITMSVPSHHRGTKKDLHQTCVANTNELLDQVTTELFTDGNAKLKGGADMNCSTLDIVIRTTEPSSTMVYNSFSAFWGTVITLGTGASEYLNAKHANITTIDVFCQKRSITDMALYSNVQQCMNNPQEFCGSVYEKAAHIQPPETVYHAENSCVSEIYR